MDKDQKESWVIIGGISLLALLLLVGFVFLGPILVDIINDIFGDGLGLRESAVLSFFLTTILLITLTITAGDGIFGELQYLIYGWFVMFAFLTIAIAYVF